jgi:type IV secretory pathway VirB2 component (pilin)
MSSFVTRRASFAIRSIVGRFFVALLIACAFATPAFAQSPWERAAANLATTFTGPLARSLALVAIVIGGLMFMFGEGGAKRHTPYVSNRTGSSTPRGLSVATSSKGSFSCR